MSIVASNTLALAFLRGFGGRGGGFAFFVIALALVGGLIWALTRSNRSTT
jgi:hypothetical protein